MTRIWGGSQRRSHFGILSVWRRFSLCILAMAAATSAQAGAWGVFEERCLEPLERGSLTYPTDLEEAGRYKNDGDTSRRYVIEPSAMVFEVSDGRADYLRWCRVIDTLHHFETSKDFFAWKDQSIAQARFADATILPDQPILQSAPGQSRPITVRMVFLRHATGVILKAEETK